VTAAAASAAEAPVADPPKSTTSTTTDTPKTGRAPGTDASKSTRSPATPEPVQAPDSTKSAPLAGGPKTPAPEAKGAKDTKDATKPAAKLSPSPITAAVSESDAEAVLVDEPTPAPKSRRFRDSRRASSASASTAAVSASLPATPMPAAIVGPTVVTTGATGAVRSDRHYRQTVTKVDLWSVTKLSLCFYLSAMFVTVVALVALWVIADAAGIIHSVEKFLGDLLSAKNFHFLSATVLRGAIVVGLVVVALQVVITVIAASFYNIFAELFGGVEITVKEEVTAE
jgi:hypothetical protein